jgi:serine/threonine-protein kinase
MAKLVSQCFDVPALGDVIAGKYQVLRQLGAGGMGVVLAARHLHLGQIVAVKVLHPARRADATTLARFRREAEAAVRLTSDHAGRVFDFGELPGGAPYIVLEYLDGCSLQTVLEQRGVLPIATAVEYVLQAIDAVMDAHSFGMIHRDIKPDNLFLTRRGSRSCIKVLDFGVVKCGTLSGSLTATGTTLGSPAYMSPEQMQGAHAVDARADIWSLGAVLYELVTGRLPFEAPSLTEVMDAVATAHPVPPRSLRPELPAEIERAILRCLSKGPSDRFSSVAELAAVLEPYREPRTGFSSVPPHPSVAPPPPTAAILPPPRMPRMPRMTTVLRTTRLARQRRRHGMHLLAVAMVAGAIGAMIGGASAAGSRPFPSRYTFRAGTASWAHPAAVGLAR